MAHKLTLPTLSLVALLGAGVGVHLGRSAIAEIDPAYFSRPASRFHADLTPFRSSARVSPLPTAGEAAPVPEPGCYGCAAPAAGNVPVYQAVATSEGSAEPLTELDAGLSERAPPVEDLQRQAELARVELYASYPVSSDDEAAVPIVEAADQREAPPALD